MPSEIEDEENTDIKRPSSSSIKQPATGLDALGGQPPA